MGVQQTRNNMYVYIIFFFSEKGLDIYLKPSTILEENEKWISESLSVDIFI